MEMYQEKLIAAMWLQALGYILEASPRDPNMPS
jgi:hypothetical protein